MPNHTTFTAVEQNFLKQGIQKLIDEVTQQHEAVIESFIISSDNKDLLTQYYNKRNDVLIELLMKINRMPVTDQMPLLEELPSFKSTLKTDGTN